MMFTPALYVFLMFFGVCVFFGGGRCYYDTVIMTWSKYLLNAFSQDNFVETFFFGFPSCVSECQQFCICYA